MCGKPDEYEEFLRELEESKEGADGNYVGLMVDRNARAGNISVFTEN